MAELEAVILAAGKAARMGCNKLLLPWGDTTIIGQLLASFPYEFFAQVTLVASDQRVADAARKAPVHVVMNGDPDQGKSHSIRLGLTAGQVDRDVMFCVADQPCLSTGVITRLIEHFRDHPGKIIVPEVDDQPANPVIFPARMRLELQELAGDDGGKMVIARHPRQVVRVQFPSAAEFIDIDTAAGYQQLRSQWKQDN